MILSVDTSAILNPWNRYYPRDRFPTFWQRFEALIAKGQLIASDEVRRELEVYDDEVLAWARAQAGLFVPLDRAVQTEVAAILQVHGGLVDAKKNKSGADPFVIALARTRGCGVLTDETVSNSAVRPRIPDVCRALAVPCIRPLELMRREGWTF